MFISPGSGDRRMKPPLVDQAMIASVRVTSSAAFTYIIEITPYLCAHNFPLFGLADGTVRKDK